MRFFKHKRKYKGDKDIWYNFEFTMHGDEILLYRKTIKDTSRPEIDKIFKNLGLKTVWSKEQ